MSKLIELPLFPLNLVLFPYKRTPLHIFEERYKQMINECLEAETEFGIVWGEDNEFRDIGSAAVVADLITRFSDGRMNIIARGTRRFRVVERFELQPYLTGIVEEIADEPEPPDLELSGRVQALYREAVRLSLGWLRTEGDEEIDSAELSYVVAGGLDLPLTEQQAILEMRSANGRLRTVSSVLEKALRGIREVKRRTGGNGHLA